MKLYIDFEFDGDLLISVAVVPATGQTFYEVATDQATDPWVQANVIPVLNRAPIGYDAVKRELQHYLQQFPTWEFVADWPEDVARMARLLLTEPHDGTMCPSPKLIDFTVWRVDPVSLIPHNALHDAQALWQLAEVG